MSENSSKRISNNSFLVDINMIEAPLFTFKQKDKIKTVEHWLETSDISNNAKSVLGGIANKDTTKMEYMKWTDSNGNDREIIAMSVRHLPNGFAMDVLFTLIALFIKKSPPILFDDDVDSYVLPTNKVNCSITEICEYMGVTDGGANIDNIKEAIMQLYAVNYHPLSEGILYDKDADDYISNKGIHLLSYEFLSRKQQSKRGSQSVIITFDELILNNIKKSFIKFLSNNTYFSLRSGLTRRLYSYIEGNKYTSNKNKDSNVKMYIKRRFATLKYKVPIDYRSNSDLKRKFAAPLDRLIKANVITDFFYGDEILVNNVKEECVYFVFKGTKKDVIDKLTVKNIETTVKDQEEAPEEEKFIFPKDPKKSLLNIGFSEGKADDLINKYTKWKLAEYILWIEDLIKNNKAKNPPAMVVFGLEQKMVDVSKTHPYITKFINELKEKEEGKKIIDQKIIKDAYEKYLTKSIKEFEDDPMYEMISISVAGELGDISANRLKVAKKMYNLAESKEDKDKFLASITKWEQFNSAENKEKTEVYKDEFNKRAVMYLQLDLYEDFKRKYRPENNN